MSPHHSDKMSQRSQVSWVTHCFLSRMDIGRYKAVSATGWTAKNIFCCIMVFQRFALDSKTFGFINKSWKGIPRLHIYIYNWSTRHNRSIANKNIRSHHRKTTSVYTFTTTTLAFSRNKGIPPVWGGRPPIHTQLLDLVDVRRGGETMRKSLN